MCIQKAWNEITEYMSDNIKRSDIRPGGAQPATTRAEHSYSGKKDPVWKLLLEKFKDPIIEILLVAALLSFLIASVEGRIYRNDRE